MKLIIFPHVPKTGGTSLRTSLRRSLAPSDYVEFDSDPNKSEVENLDDLGAIVLKSPSPLKLVIGHFDYGLHSRVEKFYSKIEYVSIIRRPADRVLSQYMHYYKFHIRQPIGVELLNSGLLSEFFVRIPGEELLKFVNLSSYMLFPELRVIDITDPSAERRAKGIIASLLHRYAHIGDAGRTQETYRYLAESLEIAPITELRENVTIPGGSQKVAIPDFLYAGELTVIDRLCALDKILFTEIFGSCPNYECIADSDLFYPKRRFEILASLRRESLIELREAFLDLMNDRGLAQDIMVHLSEKLARISSILVE